MQNSPWSLQLRQRVYPPRISSPSGGPERACQPIGVVFHYWQTSFPVVKETVVARILELELDEGDAIDHGGKMWESCDTTGSQRRMYCCRMKIRMKSQPSHSEDFNKRNEESHV